MSFKHIDRVYSFFVYVLIFLFAIFPYADNDWGWHYRYGEYFATYGTILRNNPFSWTLPQYQWANITWLYDPILYLLSSTVGFTGLSILGGLLSFLSFFIIALCFKLSFRIKSKYVTQSQRSFPVNQESVQFSNKLLPISNTFTTLFLRLVFTIKKFCP